MKAGSGNEKEVLLYEIRSLATSFAQNFERFNYASPHQIFKFNCYPAPESELGLCDLVLVILFVLVILVMRLCSKLPECESHYRLWK